SAVNAVMLRPLPFGNPSRLVSVWEENPDRGWYKNVVAPANYLDWSEQVDAFASAGGYTDWLTTVTLVGQGEPQVLNASIMTGNLLAVLGVRPLLGPGFTDADTWDAGPRTAMISYRVWQTYFRRDTGVVGRTLSLAGRPRQIVGVLPESFALPTATTDLWLPTRFGRDDRAAISFRRAHWLRVVARLKPGVSTTAANASLQTVVKRLQTEHPETNTRMGAGITPLHDFIVGDTRRPLLVLLAAAAVLLLIACANVGNLLLVNALGRGRHVSLRFALGATRLCVAEPAITESLVLSSVGGIAGFGLGWAGARALLAMQPSGMLPITDIPVDYRMLVFAVLVTTVSGIVFGMAPAVIATRQAPAQALNTGG